MMSKQGDVIEGGGGKVAAYSRGVREGLLGEVTFELRPEW